MYLEMIMIKNLKRSKYSTSIKKNILGGGHILFCKYNEFKCKKNNGM